MDKHSLIYLPIIRNVPDVPHELLNNNWGLEMFSEVLAVAEMLDVSIILTDGDGKEQLVENSEMIINVIGEKHD